MGARLRQCLKILRWREADLAEASGYDIAEVRRWLDGRAPPPLAVTAWVEALVKAHTSVPPLIRAKAEAVELSPRETGLGAQPVLKLVA